LSRSLGDDCRTLPGPVIAGLVDQAAWMTRALKSRNPARPYI
jgi:hypothetical protein